MKVIQWLIFRGVGHAQVGANEIIPHLPIVACGRTAWPALIKYQPKPPPRICEECAVALGIASPKSSPPPPKPAPIPQQGSLF